MSKVRYSAAINDSPNNDPISNYIQYVYPQKPEQTPQNGLQQALSSTEKDLVPGQASLSVDSDSDVESSSRVLEILNGMSEAPVSRNPNGI